MKSNRSFSLDIEEARRRLEVWRKSRRRGKRIPARLWAMAAAFARTHGISRISQTSGLDYNGLKRRAGATRTPRRSRLKPPPGFVELPLIGQPVLGPNCTVELERGEGARMTIRWEDKEGLLCLVADRCETTNLRAGRPSTPVAALECQAGQRPGCAAMAADYPCELTHGGSCVWLGRDVLVRRFQLGRELHREFA